MTHLVTFGAQMSALAQGGAQGGAGDALPTGQVMAHMQARKQHGCGPCAG